MVEGRDGREAKVPLSLSFSFTLDLAVVRGQSVARSRPLPSIRSFVRKKDDGCLALYSTASPSHSQETSKAEGGGRPLNVVAEGGRDVGRVHLHCHVILSSRLKRYHMWGKSRQS